jgi:hypothetical protein
MIKQPLVEIFGFPIENMSRKAERYRKLCLCPFNNKVPNCTKDKLRNPLGACTIDEEGKATIVCPVRLHQDWLILEDAARVFFPTSGQCTSLTNVKLFDKYNHFVGNIDFVLVSYDRQGHIIDFGALDTHAAYVTQNLRRPFEKYMEDHQDYLKTGYCGSNYPHADYLSSIRRRIIPQMIYKGTIFHTWKKKVAVALDMFFFNSLPDLTEVPPDQAEVSWLIYEIIKTGEEMNKLHKLKTIHTLFEPTLFQITRVESGPIEQFIVELQHRLDDHLEKGYSSETPTLTEVLIED